MSAIVTPEAVALSFAGQCDRGKVRAENQDSVRQITTPLGDLLVVADGIGGFEGGAVASRMAVEAIAASLEGMPAFFPLDIAIEEAVCRANAEIVAAAAEPGTPNHRMGSTVVLAILKQDPENAQAPVQAWIGHIGDSRAYLVHDRRLTRITRDHSAVQLLLDNNLIAPEQARNHPDASVLTRALGLEPNVKVDLNSVDLEPGDSLLLCSDGLWGYVAEEEIERVLADPELTAEQASRSLLELALDAGGHDNVGIQVARLAGTGAVAAPREPAPAHEFQYDPELRLHHLFTSELPAPSVASAPPSEIAPLEILPPAQWESEPLTVFAAPDVPETALPAPMPGPEILPAPAPEPPSPPAAELEAAPPAGAGAKLGVELDLALEPVSRLESAPELQLTEERRPAGQILEQILEAQAPEAQIPETQTPVNPILENQTPEAETAGDQIPDPQFLEWLQPYIPAQNPELLLLGEDAEPRKTTIRAIVADLWEMFKYPLGRNFDFAPEWHTVFTSAYETYGKREEAGRRPPGPTLPTLVAAVLVSCAASPKREIECLPEQIPDLHSRFKGSASEVSTLLKYLGILLLAFSASCGLVYFALFQNWFGIDYVLHLL